jgi:hypothetical protein
MTSGVYVQGLAVQLHCSQLWTVSFEETDLLPLLPLLVSYEFSSIHSLPGITNQREGTPVVGMDKVSVSRLGELCG